MLLFLNKKDVFDQKVLYSPLSRCFAEYAGGPDKHKASSFVAEQFYQRVPPERQIYHHFTCAKDSEDIDMVFGAAADTILTTQLQESGLWML